MFLSLSAARSLAVSGGEVRLEIVGDARSTALTFQEWGQALNNTGIKNVRIRSSMETDKVGIDVQGTPDRPMYIVTGEVLSRDELQLPGARFKRSELKRLAQWLEDLAQNGPPDRRPPKVAFGLTAAQLDQVIKDLAPPVGFSTQGLARREAVEKIVGKLSLPLRFEDGEKRGTGTSLRSEPVPFFMGDDKVEEELAELSRGTALAYLLRAAGYALVPQATGQKIEYLILKVQTDLKEIWPVGHEPEKPLPEMLPDLFEFRNVNVQNVSAATALDAIGKRLKTPVLYDHAALARYNIDPTKAMVSLPAARTNYSLALGKLLFPVGLKYEVRVDEAGKAFLWITSVKPMN